MRVAVVHGYFLRGTGSNLFVQNVCRELCKLGHEVLLFCQETEPEKFDFIEGCYEFDSSNRSFKERFRRDTIYPGKCLMARPNLGRLLPVYVYDTYEGYTVKEFPSMSCAEIENYLQRNRTALERFFSYRAPDLVLSNHTVMQPVYAGRALRCCKKVPHFVTVHGSCLNFSIRRSSLIESYAKEAIRNVDRLVFVSSFSKSEFVDFFGRSNEILEKSAVIPAGTDTEMFLPLQPGESRSARIGTFLKNLREIKAEEIKAGRKGRSSDEKEAFRLAVSRARDVGELKSVLGGFREGSFWAADEDLDPAVRGIDWERSKVVLYFGKYLWTKGVHLLLAAAPLIIARHPETVFLLVGFGSFRRYLEAMVAVMDAGRDDLFVEMLRQLPDIDGTVDIVHVGLFDDLLNRLKKDYAFKKEYFGLARDWLWRRTVFAGYLPHHLLKNLLPCADVVVAPSVFPEAFGLVAVEALSSGVVPVLTNHSGFAGIIKEYGAEFKDVFNPALIRPLYLDPYLVTNLAHNVSYFLAALEKLSQGERAALRQQAHRFCREKYSWAAMVKKYLELMGEVQIL